jgi:uncharacterized protein YndB with AHSA1/START domain
MGTEIGTLAIRRSIHINAPPERVWQELESLERMRAWFGTGHTLTKYEPRVGGMVETDAGEWNGERLVFGGPITVFDPPREVTWEGDWYGHGWEAPALMTIRLTPALGGTLVELFSHAFERTGPNAAQEHAGFEGGWGMWHLEALRKIVEG